MQNRQTHYTVLGVPQAASADDIKRAYRKLVLKYHPDKVQDSGDPEAVHRRFIAIQDAYEVLRDDSKRRMYDAGVFSAVDHNLSSDARTKRETESLMRTSTPLRMHQNQQYNSNIINQIKMAVMRRDEQRVANLCAEYKTLHFTADQLNAHQGTLNWLLRDCAEFKHNTIAMHLVGIGADVNQFGEILKFERYSIWTNRELVIVQCYFADMLAYWDNIQLLQMIGVEKFDWKIYMVTDRMSHNIHNKLINMHGFRLGSNEYTTYMFGNHQEYDEALALLHVDLAVRLQWLNTMCYKLVQVGDIQTLEHIYNNYPFLNRSSFWCDTDPETASVAFVDFETMVPALGCERPTAKNTIQKFMRLLNNRSMCVNPCIYQTQYLIDRHASLPLHVMANRPLRLEHLAHFSTIFLAHKVLTADLMQTLDFYYRHRCKIAASVFFGTLVGAALLTHSVAQLVLKDDRSAGNIAMIVFGSIFSIHFTMLVIMQVSLILARVLSCRQLEVNGSIDEVCLRLYQNLLLKDLLAKRHDQQQPHNSVNISSMTYGYDLQRTNANRIKNEQIELDVIEQMDTNNNRASMSLDFV